MLKSSCCQIEHNRSWTSQFIKIKPCKNLELENSGEITATKKLTFLEPTYLVSVRQKTRFFCKREWVAYPNHTAVVVLVRRQSHPQLNSSVECRAAPTLKSLLDWIPVISEGRLQDGIFTSVWKGCSKSGRLYSETSAVWCSRLRGILRRRYWHR